MDKINYKGWPNCYRLSNGVVDLIVTTDVGPRIIRYGFCDRDNEFKEYAEMMGKTGGEEWRIYGGHRLWHAPEIKPRSYFPDNFMIDIERHNATVRLVQPVETTTGIQKEMDLELSKKNSHVKVTHRLLNKNLWAVELAPWALTVAAQGGKAIVPLPPRGSHETNLLPANTLTLWSYTDMSDQRWTWGSRYIMLKQDPANSKPQKVGVMNTEGWIAYARNTHLFVKRFSFDPDAVYPDIGCSVEIFTNADMLEVETVAPLIRLQPEQAVEHVEDWFLFDDVPMPDHDADVDKYILPKIAETQIE